MAEIKRKGAVRRADVPKDILRKLNKGEIEALTLAEVLSVDLSQLLKNAFPALSKPGFNQMKKAENEKMGWIGRTTLAGEILYQEFGTDCLNSMMQHASDQVRGWGASLVKHIPDISFDKRLKMIKPIIDDTNPGVREVAWIMMRPHLANDLKQGLKILEPWVLDKKPNIRRFATEITRPRGVWCAHIPTLRKNPKQGLPLLAPVKSDPSRYVQNSVANWLNDASKDDPAWVESLCKKWTTSSATKETTYICKRALRTLRKK